jgi:tRNA(Ile)-lysidine synthase
VAGPDPAVAAGRLAVRRWLRAHPAPTAEPASTAHPAPTAEPARPPGPAPLALVACSGGTDSLALAAAAAFEAPRQGWRLGAAIVDHGLQEESRAVAARTRDQCRSLGLDPVEVLAVRVDRDSPAGVEAAARQARYDALERAARRLGAEAVWLAHTLDDQAETVLLALARGAGSKALAGMPEQRGLFARPFLGLTRAQTTAIVAASGIEPWQDPTNQPDGPYNSARSRVRAHLMPLAREILGPGFARALARTAARLRQDSDYLDAQAARLLLAAAEARTGQAASGDEGPRLTLDVAELAGAHPAIRGRALLAGAQAAGASPGGLSAAQVEALDALVTAWRGQGAVHLAGAIAAQRKCGKLEFRAFPSSERAPEET